MQNNDLKLVKFQKFLQALANIYKQPPQVDNCNIDATIKRFEFTFELAWKTLRTYFLNQGLKLNSPKAVLQQAFLHRFIPDENIWLQMLHDRNLSSHEYGESLAQEIYQRIQLYVPQLQTLYQTIRKHCE